MANYDSNYAIAQEISARIGNSPIPFDSVYSIALEIYNELGGEPAEFDSVYSILLGILPLVEGGIASNVIDDNSIVPNKTWSSSKIDAELEALAGTGNSDIEGKETEDFTFVTELPESGEENQQVIIKGENSDTLYKYVESEWVEQTPDAAKLYFDVENEALYSYVTSDNQFAPVSLVDTIVVGSNLNTNADLKALKTVGVYNVIQRLTSSTKGDYIKNWTLTVANVDYEEYDRGDKIYQKLQSNYTIKKRTWSATRASNDGWTSFSTYYAGEIKDSTTSNYYTWSSSKLNGLFEGKQDALVAGNDNIEFSGNTIYARGYKYYPEIKSFKTIAPMTSSSLINKYTEEGNIIDLPSEKTEGFIFGSRNVLQIPLSTIIGKNNDVLIDASTISTTNGITSCFALGEKHQIVNGNAAVAIGDSNYITGGVGYYPNNPTKPLQIAIGNNLIVNNAFETALGQHNVNHSGDTEATRTRISLGGGCNRKSISIDDTEKFNIIEEMQNGDLYLLGVGGYDGVHIKSETGYENTQTLQEFIQDKNNEISSKQDKLTAGNGIQISGNTISAIAIEDASELPESSENKNAFYRLNSDENVYTSVMKSRTSTTTNRLPDEQQIDKAYLYDSENDIIYYYKGIWKFICTNGEISLSCWGDNFDDDNVYFTYDNAENINSSSETLYYGDTMYETVDEDTKTVIDNETLEDLKSFFAVHNILIPIPAIYNAPESAQIGNATAIIDGNTYWYTGETGSTVIDEETITGYKWQYEDDADDYAISTKPASEVYYHIGEGEYEGIYYTDTKMYYDYTDFSTSTTYSIPQLNAPDSEQVNVAWIQSSHYDYGGSKKFYFTGEQKNLRYADDSEYETKYIYIYENEQVGCSLSPVDLYFSGESNTYYFSRVTTSEGVEVWGDTNYYITDYSTVKYQRTDITEVWDWEKVATQNYVNSAITNIDLSDYAKKVDIIIPIDLQTQVVDWTVLNSVETGIYRVQFAVNFMGQTMVMNQGWATVSRNMNSVAQTIIITPMNPSATGAPIQVHNRVTANGTTWYDYDFNMGVINDSNSSTETTYSSNKIESLISALDARLTAIGG